MTFGKNAAILSAVVGLGISAAANAANITFSGPVPIGTADSTLDLPGTVVGAATFGGGPTTVTTATQTINFTSSGGGVANITQAGGSIGGASGFSGSGNANFDSVLGNFAYDGNPTIIQLQNLTVGTQYQIQVFGLDDRGCCGGRTIFFSDGNGNNSTSIAENSNQYFLGTFTADATTQNVESVGAGQSQSNFNAVVVRTSVPEPASLSLLGMGAMALLGRRRRA